MCVRYYSLLSFLYLKCSVDSCHKSGIAIQTRLVVCLDSEGYMTSATTCDVSLRPNSRQTCELTECVPTWQISGWSEVSHVLNICPFCNGKLAITRYKLAIIYILNIRKTYLWM